jgi:AraC family transcriptional regulator
MQQAQMGTSFDRPLEAPRVENSRPLLIAGLRGQFRDEPWKGTPELWQRFAPHHGKIPGQVDRTAYGLCFLLSNGVDYLAGIEVSGISGLPADFTTVNIPPQKYLVFAHKEHVSRLHLTCQMVSEWLPGSGYEARNSPGSPDFFERYAGDFDPRTGMGGIEVWVPIKD